MSSVCVCVCVYVLEGRSSIYDMALQYILLSDLICSNEALTYTSLLTKF